VWRELRRLKVEDAPKSCVDIFHYAKRADWMKFTLLMGGVFAGRKQTLKAYYVEDEENQYGEIPKIIKGVKAIVDVIETRLYEWTVQRKVAGTGSEMSGSIAEGEAAPPWTRVNNCTPAHLLEEIPIESYQERGEPNVF